MRYKKYKYLLLPATAAIISFAVFFALANIQQLTGSEKSFTVSNGAYAVDIKDGRAFPDTLTVPVGKTVQFNARDGQKHELAVGEGGDQHHHEGSFNSGEFGSGEAWRATFNQPGTYFFHDHYNPKVNILVVVYRPSASN